jgi:hypothetical protein
MSAISFPATAGLLSLFLAAAALPAQTSIKTAAPPGTAGMSLVRIVRLSEVRGAVQVQRAAGHGFESAMINLPIVEADRIRTGTGIAEVEFEDNSTLRLATNTEVDFPELERTAAGVTVTDVHVVRGMVYVSLVKKETGDFTVEFGLREHLQKLQVPPSGHIRLQVNGAGAQLAVLGGSVPVNGANGPADISRNHTVSFTSAGVDNPAVTKKVAAESFDAWDRQSAAYHARTATLSALGKAPYSYGLNSMAYYGAFSDVGGCGTMWYPYFAGASWDPYGNGAWAWYPGAGYSWVSPYPWGWMPYHYGAWSYCPGTGWGWMPYGGWNGLNNSPTVPTRCASAGCRTHPLPPRPTRPPRAGASTLIAVKATPLITSGMTKRGSFLFIRGSAGLGIPREGLGKLRGFSRNSIRHGVAATPVYLYVNSDAGFGRRVAGNYAPVAVHRGYAPQMGMSGPGYAPRGGSYGSAAETSGNATSSEPSMPMSTSMPSMPMRSSVSAVRR